MNCAECRRRTEAYFDGELDARASERVAAHLAVCASCASLFDGLVDEAELYKNYARDIETTPALWTAIEARLSVETIKPRARRIHVAARLGEWLAGALVSPRVAFGAAAAVILVCLTVIALYQSRREITPRHETVSANRETEVTPDAGASAPAPDARVVRASQPENPERVPRRNESRATAIPARLRSNMKDEHEVGVRVVSTRKRAVTHTESARDRRQIESRTTDNLFSAGSTESEATLAAMTERRNEIQSRKGFEGMWRNHADQSQLLLRSFRNTRVRGKSVDVAYERTQARRLLARNIVLRRDAERRGRVLTAEALSRLEPVLLDIANLPAKTSPDDVSAVNSRIGANELVATLNAQSILSARAN